MATETVRYTSQCGCYPATASGPRLVFRQALNPATGALAVVAKSARMACDVCDTPWKHDGKLHPATPTD